MNLRSSVDGDEAGLTDFASLNIEVGGSKLEARTFIGKRTRRASSFD